MKLTRLSIFFALIIYSAFTRAQCVTSYPYTEDFELTNGNWVSGGSGNDWAWGQVSKSVISQAASGNNCWVTGGLNTPFYNYNERSYIQSPCFDFTNLQAPYISFKIWWESENIYDGTNLQYSTDGITWVNVGAYNEPADCMTQNWYNSSNINNLTNLAGVKHGWSGNSQNSQGNCQGGNGSNGWKLAKHCLSNLAGLPQVYLRFTFGAGTTCNDYDGIAIDDITIAAAASAAPTFSYTCNGNSVTFTANTTCANNLQWSFGDGVTGSGTTASHTYTTSGIKNVSLSITGLCGATYSTTNTIEILEVNTTSLAASCAGSNNGLAIAQPVNGAGPFSYTWNTTPVQTTDTAFNLTAGSYTVTVTATGVCASVATAIVPDGAYITAALTVVADTCNLLTGTIIANVNGGATPYLYQWSNGTNTTLASNLGTGPYQLTVTDANGCSATAQAVVPYTSGISFQVVERKDVSCLGFDDGKVTIQVNGGQEPYTYVWSNNANTPSIQKLTEGAYLLNVLDSKGCADSIEVRIEKEQCQSYVDFPTAFSPNGDGVNDIFRARYSPDVKKFNLKVYNRWGELVFVSNNILDGWDGTYKNVAQPMSIFVWVAEYSFIDDSSNTSSGNITLLR